jgi:hypothetical protein
MVEKPKLPEKKVEIPSVAEEKIAVTLPEIESKVEEEKIDLELMMGIWVALEAMH